MITRLTKESYLQSISLKKLFKSKRYLHNSFRLKKRHLNSIEKIHSKKEKKIIIKKIYNNKFKNQSITKKKEEKL